MMVVRHKEGNTKISLESEQYPNEKFSFGRACHNNILEEQSKQARKRRTIFAIWSVKECIRGRELGNYGSILL